jgi:hypothetical protein
MTFGEQVATRLKALRKGQKAPQEVVASAVLPVARIRVYSVNSAPPLLSAVNNMLFTVNNMLFTVNGCCSPRWARYAARRPRALRSARSLASLRR